MTKKNPQTKSPKKFRRYIRRREAMEAAARFGVANDGGRQIIRFSWEQRIQHWILLLSFTTLGITGLAQTFYNTPVGNAILLAVGGIEAARQIHHVAAVIFGIEAIYHIGVSIYELFVYHKISRIWPDWSDFTNLIDMLKFNLSLSAHRPKFDRFTFEEKAEYWALIWGTIIMGATGLTQLFPLQVTSILPGWIIPIARAFHRWEAILAVAAILTWHLYHTLIKTRNFSIFNGVISIAQMKEEHPVELAYLEHAALALETSPTWPALIEFSLDEVEEEKAPKPKEIIKVEAETAAVTAEAPEQSVETVREVAVLNDAPDATEPEVASAEAKREEESASDAANEAPLTESFSSGEAQ